MLELGSVLVDWEVDATDVDPDFLFGRFLGLQEVVGFALVFGPDGDECTTAGPKEPGYGRDGLESS